MALDKNAQKATIRNYKLLFGVPKKNFILLPIVNANNEQLKKWGFLPFKNEQGIETEPNYVRPKLDRNGASLGYNLAQLEFYFKCIDPIAESGNDEKLAKFLTNAIFRFSFYIEDIDQGVSSKNTYCYVNVKGETCWAPDENSLTLNSFCTSTEALRVVKRGEKDFLSAIHEIAGLSNGIIIDNIEALFKGDFREIVNLIKDINSQKDYKGFKALLAVATSSKGNPYQDVFTRGFDYGAKDKPLNITKQIKEQQTSNGGQYAYKPYFGNKVSLGLTEFKDEMIEIHTPITFDKPRNFFDEEEAPF